MTHMFMNIKTYILIIISALLLLSCGGNKQEDIGDVAIDSSNDMPLDSQKISAQNVFNAIPGRSEILNLIQQSKAEYNVDALNSPYDVNKYTLESSKALNLGVYGSDLNAANVFEQNQESITFFKCVSSLAKGLGISNCFDEKMGDRMEANKENRDSTLEIISQSFKNADKFLKANGRPGTSSLIVAGAWIEGLHLACITANDTKNEAIVKAIFEQNESLKYLIELLEASKLSEESSYLITDLKALKTLFDAKTDKAFTIQSLAALQAKNTEIRTKVISSK